MDGKQRQIRPDLNRFLSWLATLPPEEQDRILGEALALARKMAGANLLKQAIGDGLQWPEGLPDNYKTKGGKDNGR